MSAESSISDDAEAASLGERAAKRRSPFASRRSRLRVLGLGVALVVVAAGGFGLGRTAAGFRQLPEIAATLPGDESEYNHELDARVRERFPLGSSDAKLIAELARQGFTPEWRERGDANVAVFVWRGLLCSKVVRVTWRADDNGALTQTNGAYQSHCDL